MTRPVLRPTRDLDAAVQRLQAGAGHLICRDGHDYGGSIHSDLLAVLYALSALRALADASVSAPRR